MKRFLFALFTLAFLSANAQTVEEIIQKHTTAMGGLDVFNKVSTLKMTGVVTTQGMDLPLTTQIINGKGVRTDVEAMGQAVVNVYFNGTGWTINPFAGSTEATDLTGVQLNDLKTQAYLASNLMDYKNRGHQVELLGQEEVEGINTFKIKMTIKEDGRVTTYNITNDYMLLRSVTKREMQGQEFDVETFYSDFKEFGGIKIACSRIQKIDGQVFQEVNIEKAELNVAVDESIFKK